MIMDDYQFKLNLFLSENYGDITKLDRLVRLVDTFLKKIGLEFKYAERVAKDNLRIVPSDKYVLKRIYGLTLAGIWNALIDDHLEGDVAMNCVHWMKLLYGREQSVAPLELLFKEVIDIMSESLDENDRKRLINAFSDVFEARITQYLERHDMKDISLKEYYDLRNKSVFAEYLLFSIEFGVDHYICEKDYNNSVMIGLRKNFAKFITILKDIQSVRKDQTRDSLALNCIAIKSKERGLSIDETLVELKKDLESIEEKLFLVIADVSSHSTVTKSYIDCFSNFLNICVETHL